MGIQTHPDGAVFAGAFTAELITLFIRQCPGITACIGDAITDTQMIANRIRFQPHIHWESTGITEGETGVIQIRKVIYLYDGSLPGDRCQLVCGCRSIVGVIGI